MAQTVVMAGELGSWAEGSPAMEGLDGLSCKVTERGDSRMSLGFWFGQLRRGERKIGRGTGLGRYKIKHLILVLLSL